MWALFSSENEPQEQNQMKRKEACHIRCVKSRTGSRMWHLIQKYTLMPLTSVELLALAQRKLVSPKLVFHCKFLKIVLSALQNNSRESILSKIGPNRWT